MNWKLLFAAMVRRGATMLGMYMVAHGLLDKGQLDNWVGGFILFAGVAESAWDKYGVVLVDKYEAKLRGLPSAVLFALLFIGALTPHALAADVLPLKAAPSAPAAPCDITGCTGFRAGIQFWGSGTGVNVLNLGSVTANGTFMGGEFGYQLYNGTYHIAVVGSLAYDLTTPGDIVGASFSNKLFATERVEFGGPLANILNIPPFDASGVLSTGVPFVTVGACQHGNLSGYCAGAGVHFYVPKTVWTIDALYLNAQYGTTQTAPNQTINTENLGMIGAAYHFKGF